MNQWVMAYGKENGEGRMMLQHFHINIIYNFLNPSWLHNKITSYHCRFYAYVIRWNITNISHGNGMLEMFQKKKSFTL